MILELLIVFGLNIVGSTLKTMETIMVSKSYMKPVYIIMFADSIVYMTGFKMVAEGGSFFFILAFAFGKLVGVFIADKIENRLALGLIEITIYAKPLKAFSLADYLRNEVGYSVTTIKGYGVEGKERFGVLVEIERKELSTLRKHLKKEGFEKATLVIREIKSVEGHIKSKLMSNCH